MAGTRIQGMYNKIIGEEHCPSSDILDNCLLMQGEHEHEHIEEDIWKDISDEEIEFQNYWINSNKEEKS